MRARSLVRRLRGRSADSEVLGTGAFLALLDSVPDAMVIADDTGTIFRSNERAEALFGYDRGELAGRPLLDLIPEELREHHRVHQGAFFQEPASRAMGAGLELEGRRKDGSRFPVDISLSFIPGEQGILATAAVRDITERIRMEDDLRSAREIADAASQAKSAFLSRVSHELRTPLNAILGFTQILQLDGLDEDQQEGLFHISRAGRHLLQVVNEVIDISRIEANELSLSVESISLPEVVDEVISITSPEARKSGITVAHPAESDIFVRADRQRLRQVLLNLVSNAVKYNRPGGRVDVSVHLEPGDVVIDVRDTGPGIEPEALPRLFTPFDRLGAEQTKVEGTGVGLAISQRMTTAMGGRLDVASEVGVGSTFSVHLEPADAPLADAPRGEPELVHVGASTREHVVVYVEDNPSNALLMERVVALRPHWHLIHTQHGGEALDVATRHHADLVLLDLHLPDVPGELVLQTLRTHTPTRKVPVVMVSADVTPGQQARLRTQGADGYLSKPISIPDLLGLLDAVRRGDLPLPGGTAAGVQGERVSPDPPSGAWG